MQLNFIVVRSAVLLAPRVHVRTFRTRRMADAGRPRTRQSLRLIEGFSEINTFLLRRLARVYMGTRPLSKGTFKDKQNDFQGTKLERSGSGRLVRPGDPVAALGGNTDPMQEGHISKTRWRWNKYTWDWKLFDPLQIFFSPTIRYCDLPHYANAS